MRGFGIIVTLTLLLFWTLTGFSLTLDDTKWVLGVDRINVVVLAHAIVYCYTLPTMVAENRSIKESNLYRSLRLPYCDPIPMQEMIIFKAVGAAILAGITFL